MNERVKELRKILKISQDSFSSKINISRSHYALIESGTKKLTDRVISDICREFNVNEDWLRYDNGEMFIEPENFSLDEYIKSKGATQLELDLIKSYFEIPEDLRNSIMNSFKNSVLKQMRNTEEAATTESSELNDIDYEVESYRKELEAEQKGRILSASEKPKGA